MDRLLECALFLAGLSFGSFLNVCISRIPRDESVVTPPSHCPACGKRIGWRDNIPLISWLVLRGRCRQCGTRISLRYPLVELLTALVFLGCYLYFGWTWLTLKFCIFGFLLIGLIFMDAETGLLPREFTYSGIVLGLLFAWFVPVDSSATELMLRVYRKQLPGAHWLSLLDALLAGVIGAGFFYLAWALYYLVRKRHGLGFGDVTLMGMSGTFLGVKLTVMVIFFAPLVTVVYVVFLLAREALSTKKLDDTASEDQTPLLSREIPFGVFLGACSLAAAFVGESVWSWYLRQVLM
ncbi:MAG TPA: prepilin peptidase [Terriglobales bacterium]|nr:prepilin peptidase [Terriglobales bacterium]